MWCLFEKVRTHFEKLWAGYKLNLMEKLKSKLGDALSKPITEECQVVYILVQTRKLLESSDPKVKERYPVLKLYCDWVLHIKIEGTKSINDLLTKIEGACMNPPNQASLPDTMLEVVDFEEFRKQIKDFLSEQRIDNSFSNYGYWQDFRTYFIETLTDFPIRPKNREILEFCFKKSGPDDIKYIIKFRDRQPIRGSFDLRLMLPLDEESQL